MTTTDIIEGIITAGSVVVPTAIGILKWAKGRFDACEKERIDLQSMVTALQVSVAAAAPEWVRDSKGIIRSVSPEFVRVIGVRLDLHSKDFLGKHVSKVDGLSPSLPDILTTLEKMAATHKYAVCSYVEMAPGFHVTMIKMCIAGLDNDPMFRTIFLPVETIVPTTVNGNTGIKPQSKP